MHCKSLCLVFFIVLLTGVGWAQQSGESLGETARKERERRKSQAQPTVVLTNEGALKKEGENPQSAPKPTTQSAAGGQEAAGSSANIPATPTLSVNGKQTKLTHVLAVPDEDRKGDITVVLSDVPVTEDDVRFFMRLVDKAKKGKLHAAKINFDAAGQVNGFAVYDPALSYGYVSGAEGLVNFQRKTFDGRTVAGTVTTPNMGILDDRYQVAGTFTARIERPLTEAESAQAADKPAVKVAMAYINAIRAKDVARMKSYMTPESARQFDALSPADQKMQIELSAELDGNTKWRVAKYTQTGNAAEVKLVGGPARAQVTSVMKLVLVGGSWKIAAQE